MIQNDLILDLGMHHGDDAGFYLSKGFRVVSVDAFPPYAEQAAERFAEPVAAGRMQIVNRALADDGTKIITLFVNEQKNDAHTVRQDIAAANQQHQVFSYKEMPIPTITIGSLFETYGVPYYMKVDIEGMDDEAAKQLVGEKRKPPFVSFESSSITILGHLLAAGYDKFQLINQYHNPATQPPADPREGRYSPVQFTGHMSGLFGRELDPTKWVSYQDMVQLFLTWTDLQRRAPELAPGWCDFHATSLTHEELRAANTL